VTVRPSHQHRSDKDLDHARQGGRSTRPVRSGSGGSSA